MGEDDVDVPAQKPARPKALMHLESVKLFYEESKAARTVMDELLIRYRTNTTAVLALATGAATFFGFSDSPKGPFFIASLVAYGLATFLAIAIYWPTRWRVNAVYDAAAVLQSKTVSPTKMYWDLALGHQQAIEASMRLVESRFGRAARFRALLFATSLVVIFAGVNVYQQSQFPDISTPTRIVIEEDQR